MLDKVKEHLNKPKSIQVDKDYWFASIMGLVFFAILPLYFVFAFLFGIMTFESLPLSVLILFAISSILALLFVHYLVTERRFKRINTDLSKSKNNELLKCAFVDLGWNFLGGINSYRIEESKSPLSPFGYVRFQAMPVGNGILYNVTYTGSSRARFPFFLGFKTYVSWKFKRAVKVCISNSLEPVKKIMLSKNKITVSEHYWFQTVMGLIKLFIFTFATVIFIFYYPAVATPVFFILLFIFISSLYLVITERTFKKLVTGFSKSQNEELLIKVLEQLGWEHSKSMNR